jgi:hypothetical protein
MADHLKDLNTEELVKRHLWCSEILRKVSPEAGVIKGIDRIADAAVEEQYLIVKELRNRGDNQARRALRVLGEEQDE